MDNKDVKIVSVGPVLHPPEGNDYRVGQEPLMLIAGKNSGPAIIAALVKLTAWADESPEHRKVAIGYKPNEDHYFGVEVTDSVAGEVGFWADDELAIAAQVALEGITIQTKEKQDG